MKYVFGFDTEYMHKEYKLGYKHVIILEWFHRLIKSGKAVPVKHEDHTFYWMHYDSVIKSCPMLGVGKKMLANLVKDCCQAGILEAHPSTIIPNHAPGLYSTFRFIKGVLAKIKPAYKPFPPRDMSGESPYHQYLTTDAWKEKRQEARERDNHACVQCGSKQSLNVHHLTYENIFNEKLEDLITLCSSCHNATHGIEVS